MKLIIPSALRRAALCLPAVSLMLAPLAAQARFDNVARDSDRVPTSEDTIGGRAGAIDEINFGPVGMDVLKQREERPNAGGSRLLSGRVVDMKGQTLYVERDGVVVPLDLSALRITKQPKSGQQIVASYAVERTRNVALSLAGEVAESR